MTLKFFLHHGHRTGNVQPVRFAGVAPCEERDFSHGLRPAGSPLGCDNQRAFCSLSDGSLAGKNPAARNGGHGNTMNGGRLRIGGTATQRTGGQRTNARHTDIKWRNLLGSSLLDGASVSSGEGQPNFPGEQGGRKTSAPQSGGCGFLSFSSYFQEARAVSDFPWGGRSFGFLVLFLSFNSFPLLGFKLVRELVLGTPSVVFTLSSVDL